MGDLVLPDQDIKSKTKGEELEDLYKILIGLSILKKKIEKLKKIDQESSNLFIQMISYAFINQPTLAIEIGEQLKIKQPKFLHIYIIQAACYLSQKNLEKAETCFKQAHQIKPQKSGILLNLHEICMAKGEYQKAIDYINEIKKFSNAPHLEYLIGIAYQKMNMHQEAIQCFEIAHQGIQRKRYFIAKMESFMALEKFEEALECCLIAAYSDPGNQELKTTQNFLIDKLQINEEQQLALSLKLEEENNYTIETYKKKRDLEAQQTQLILKQSKIRVKPSQINQTQSQIKINKQNQQIMYYLDAIYYTFTNFFALYIHADQICTPKIAKYLSTKQNIEIFNFTDLIRDTIQSCYPDLKDLSTQQISNLLIQWHDKKIKDNQDDIFSHIHKIFNNLINSNLKQQLIDRLNEEYSQGIQRKKKNLGFHAHLTQINSEVEKKGYTIYKEQGGLIGLEHAIMILGFLIKFPELVDDQDSFENLLFRGLTKEDFLQLLKSQSKIQVSKNEVYLLNISQQQMQLDKSQQSVYYDSNFMSKFA